MITLLRASLLLTLMVILLGAYTRLADAGLGCPDWPGCYGHLTVPNESHELAKANALYPELTVEADKAWLEMIHRYFAGCLGLLVFAIAYLGLKHRALSVGLSLALPAVIVFQALLGMWTVTMKLMPIVVMGHLLGGFTLFSLLCLSYWHVTRYPLAHRLADISVSRGLRWLAGITALIVVAQVALGGWTSSNYAALMCTSLPICEGNWTQYLDFETAFELIQPKSESYEFGTLDYGARMTIHVTHRFGAMLVMLFVLALVFVLKRYRNTEFTRCAHWLLGLLVLQIALGVSNVLLSLPLAIAVAHNLGAALLLIATLRANYLLSQVRLPTKATQRISPRIPASVRAQSPKRQSVIDIKESAHE